MRKIQAGISSWLLLLLFFPVLLPAQQTKRYDEPTAGFERAMDLMGKEKYAPAQEIFGQIIQDISDPSSLIQIQASYYHAQCAYELYHDNATDLFKSFIRTHPENTLAQLAQFQLARLHYRNKEYREAINAFKKTDIRQLNSDEVHEYFFKTGYCYLKTDNLPQAEQAFSKLLNSSSKYQAPANYYYAHIAYEKNDDQKALEGFERLTEDETFGDIVPYYILTIKYRQKKYDEVIALYEVNVFAGDDKKNLEVMRMVADANFKTGQYHHSIPLLERYSRMSASRMAVADWYQLGYAYSAREDYTNAIGAFQKATVSGDTISQNAYYHLGYCYIQTNQKPFAMNAFLAAYKMNVDPVIQEDALFNYAKLAYELSYDPYNEAIKALRQFIADYPESERVDEANLYLVNLFMSSSNYTEALETLEKMRQRNEQANAAYQLVAHNRGIELFNAKDYNEAMGFFRKSLEFPFDPAVSAANYYWMAECYYRLSSYESAIEYYKKYLSQQAAYQTNLYYLASYNLGYACFMKKDYAQAINHFRKFTTGGFPDQVVVTDGYLRIADSYFVLKSYDDAIHYYNKALEKAGADSDYALLQKALAFGGKGNFEIKAGLLKEFLSRFPKSTYTEEVLYELGTTYILMNRDDEAQGYFARIPKDYPSGKFVKKSLLKSGLIYYNSNNTDLALDILKTVITNYPGSEESREALEIIRNIYADLNQVDKYLAYSETLSFTDMTQAAQDSLSYFTAENRYRRGDCQGAVEGFTSYIEHFQQGAFLVQANFYRAECQRKSYNPGSSLDGYLFVLSQPPSQFTESAMEKAAELFFEQGQFLKALEHFQHLEGVSSSKSIRLTALTGQMRCFFLLDDYANAITSAETVISSDITDQELMAEAHFITAKSAMAIGNTDAARKSFILVRDLVQDERAAESQFNLALMLYHDSKYEEAENQTFALINEYASFDYWVARGFILLSDIYVGMNNFFQAKQTLQSIIDNYPGEDLRSEAAMKLELITAMEKANQNEPTQEESQNERF